MVLSGTAGGLAGQRVPSTEAVRSLKQLVRGAGDAAADSAVWYLFQRLGCDDSQSRLLALELLDVLFRRSAAARRLVVGDLATLLSLAVGVGPLRQGPQRSAAVAAASSSSRGGVGSSSSSSSSGGGGGSGLALPGPPEYAAKLRARAVALLEDWAESPFGDLYAELRITHRYLSESHRIKVASSSNHPANGGAGGGSGGAAGGNGARRAQRSTSRNSGGQSSTGSSSSRSSNSSGRSSSSSSSSQRDGRMRTDPSVAHRTRVAYEKARREMFGGGGGGVDDDDDDGGSGTSGLDEVEATVAELEEALRLLVPTAADELHWRGLDREKRGGAKERAEKRRVTAPGDKHQGSSSTRSISTTTSTSRGSSSSLATRGRIDDDDEEDEWEDGDLEERDDGAFGNGGNSSDEDDLNYFDDDDFDDDDDDDEGGLGATVDVAGLGSRGYTLEIEVDLELPGATGNSNNNDAYTGGSGSAAAGDRGGGIGGGRGGGDEEDEENEQGKQLLRSAVADARRLISTRHLPALRRWQKAAALALAAKDEVFLITAPRETDEEKTGTAAAAALVVADGGGGGGEAQQQQQSRLQALAAAEDCQLLKGRLLQLKERIKDVTRRCGGVLL